MLVLTTDKLRELCEHAEQLRFANGPNRRFWKDVAANGKHVVVHAFKHSPNLAFWQGIDHGFNFAHNGGVNIRALVNCRMANGKKVTLLCDFDQNDFEDARLASRNHKATSR